MPFQALPSSPGFQLPQAPRWEPFAQAAIEAISKRPIVNTAEIVEKAADQINNILEKHSPEAKMERAMKMMQLQAMHHVWQDYNSSPNKYQMTAHGPVLIDPLARTERVMKIQESAERIKTSQGKRNTPDIVQQFENIQNGINSGQIKVNKVNQSPDAPEAVPGAPVGGDEPKPDTELDVPPPSTVDTGQDNTAFAPEEPFTTPA